MDGQRCDFSNLIQPDGIFAFEIKWLVGLLVGLVGVGSARVGSNPTGVVRISLVGQDTWFSPRRPGFKSRMRNWYFGILVSCSLISVPLLTSTFLLASQQTRGSSVGRAGDCKWSAEIPRSLVRFRPSRAPIVQWSEYLVANEVAGVRFPVGAVLVGWPSGLRRQFKALVSSEAWVRIPLQSHFFGACAFQKVARPVCLVRDSA